MKFSRDAIDRFEEMKRMMKLWGWEISKDINETKTIHHNFDDWIITNKEYSLFAVSNDFEKLFAYADGHYMGATKAKCIIQNFNHFNEEE